jgi:hypothetical protein
MKGRKGRNGCYNRKISGNLGKRIKKREKIDRKGENPVKRRRKGGKVTEKKNFSIKCN